MAKLSDIFDMAADKHLWPIGEHEWSCNAVRDAAGYVQSDADLAIKFLSELGVDVVSGREFDGIKDAQAVRYAWLKLCAQVAREEGL